MKLGYQGELCKFHRYQQQVRQVNHTTLILSVPHCTSESENSKSRAFYKLTTSLEWKIGNARKKQYNFH